MKLQIKKGSIDVTIYLFIQDSSSTIGAGLTGLVYNSAGLVCYYVRPLGNATQLTLATQTVTGAHSDGGFVEVSSSNMPGVYRLDLSDAVIATGVNSVTLLLKGATNMAQLPVEIELVAYDPQDATALGISRIDASISSRASQTSVDTVDDFLDTEIAAIKAKTDNLPSDPADASDIASSFTTVNTKLDTIDDFLDTEVAAIKAKTDNLPSDPADASDIASSFSTVNTKLDTIDDFLDTEVLAIKTVTDKLDDTLEDDGGTYRFTENALEEAPSGGGGGASAAAIADAVWDEKIDEHLTDRSYGAHIGIHLPFVAPDIDYKRIKKVVTEVVDTLPAPIQPKEPNLIPISEGLQALLIEIRAIKLPEIPKVDLNPIQSQIEGLEQAIKAIKIPETDFTETHKLIQARNDVLDQLSEVQEEIKSFHLEDVRELLENGVEKIKTAVEGMNKKFDNTQMVILKNETKQEPKSVLEEYLKLE